MKELSIEEKAKRYDEAIEKAKSLYKAAEPMSGCNVIIETLFPELKESEDERIRKAIINLVDTKFGDRFPFDGFTREQMLAWLEKKGEQKPAWSEEDESWFKKLELMALSFSNNDSYRKKFFDRLKSLRDRIILQPKQEWCKEDEEHVNSLLKRLEGLCRNEFATTRFAINEDEDWLKSLKDRYTWKPSEKEIKALEVAIEHCDKAHFVNTNPLLVALYEDLKKLKKE